MHLDCIIGELVCARCCANDWVDKISRRDAGPYDDRVGPTVLVIALFLCVITNFWLRFSH
jgi:hypothetical protein